MCPCLKILRFILILSHSGCIWPCVVYSMLLLTLSKTFPLCWRSSSHAVLQPRQTIKFSWLQFVSSRELQPAHDGDHHFLPLPFSLPVLQLMRVWCSLCTTLPNVPTFTVHTKWQIKREDVLNFNLRHIGGTAVVKIYNPSLKRFRAKLVLLWPINKLNNVK